MQTQAKIENALTIDSMKPGEEAVITGYTEDIADEIRLLEVGLIVGTIVRFIKKAPFGDPIQIRVRGFDLFLRRNLAKGIIAEYR